MKHLSVLKNEVIQWLDLSNRKLIIDATLGLGGHSEAILSDPSFTGDLIGFDQDMKLLNGAEKRLENFASRFKGFHDNFRNLDHFTRREAVNFDGILFDLGVASPHFDTAERGFSFLSDAPLDMRMNREEGFTAEEFLRKANEAEIRHSLFSYGEEPLAGRISRKIVEARSGERGVPERSRPQSGLRSEGKRSKNLPSNFCGAEPIPIRRQNSGMTTGELSALVEDAYRQSHRSYSKVHPATKTFQALRIVVNDELNALQEGLQAAMRLISPGGRILVISYHSLEDRIVKHLFRKAESPCICPPKIPRCICGKIPLLKILTKKPIVPTDDESRLNPRSRSAKMRVVEKL